MGVQGGPGRVGSGGLVPAGLLWHPGPWPAPRSVRVCACARVHVCSSWASSPAPGLERGMDNREICWLPTRSPRAWMPGPEGGRSRSCPPPPIAQFLALEEVSGSLWVPTPRLARLRGWAFALGCQQRLPKGVLFRGEGLLWSSGFENGQVREARGPRHSAGPSQPSAGEGHSDIPCAERRQRGHCLGKQRHRGTRQPRGAGPPSSAGGHPRRPRHPERPRPLPSPPGPCSRSALGTPCSRSPGPVNQAFISFFSPKVQLCSCPSEASKKAT